jgi:methionine synthase II (cobalamin-independent)
MTSESSRPVPPAATGIGSLPGEDLPEAVRQSFGLLGERPGVPYLPELPQRGVGADLAGRGAALLVDLYAEVQPSGWRLVGSPGRDSRRALGFLHEDMDVLEELTQGYVGPLKVQAAGPWTLAATIELHYGDRMLADPGACRDLVASLAQGLALHLAEIQKRVPGAELILQLDEPALPGVLKGTVPTASGFGRLRTVQEATARDALRTVIDAAEVPVVVHCCAPDYPFELIRSAGASGFSFDWSLPGTSTDDVLAESIEAGILLYAGVVPSTDPVTKVAPAWRDTLDSLLGLRRLGFSAARLAQSLVVTPSCGLAGASPAWARRAQQLCMETASALAETE